MKIDYQSLLDKAMLEVVKAILLQIQTEGIIEEDQSFYVSFRTDFAGVILSRNIKQRYPKEITIVLQHQFRNLKVLDDRFSVNIAFGGVAETIEIPFAALTNFTDPIAEFNLQFRQKKDTMEQIISQPKAQIIEKEVGFKKIAANKKTIATQLSPVSEVGKVIYIDKFRKKQDNNKVV
jgi:hypothetical protein